MADFSDKIVTFYYWCPKCKHKDKSGDEEPCNECLAYPVNQDSRKPVKFDGKDEVVKKRKKKK